NWKPSLSTGVIFRWILHYDDDTKKDDGIGVGIGANFVFVPNATNSTPAPAITFHVGKRSLQAFVGSIFVPTATVDMPGGGDKAVLPQGFDTSTLIRNDGGRKPTFFAGIVVGGVSLTKP